jgi:hypothetical protein
MLEVVDGLDRGRARLTAIRSAAPRSQAVGKPPR